MNLASNLTDVLNGPKKVEKMATNMGNDDLGPLSSDVFLFRVVDEVNGRGAIECADFIPTRHELFAIAKHWAQVLIGIQWWNFQARQSGSVELRLSQVAQRRLGRIEAILGEAEVQKAVDEVQNKFAEGIDPKRWQIFLHGTSEQWGEVAKEFRAET